MYRKLFIVAVAVAIAACSENKSGESRGTTQVPEALAFNKPVVGQKLTRAQVKEIAAAFSNKPKMMVPPGELIFKPKEMTLAEYKRRESQLLEMDSNSYSFLQAINGNCNKGRPTSSVEATYPTDGDVKVENLRTNDRLSMSSRVLISEKSACPVNVDGQATLGAKIEDIDHAANRATMSANMGMNINLRSLDDRYSQLLDNRGLILQTTISGLATVADTKGRAMVSFALNGSFFSLTEEIPVSMTMQFLNRLKKVVSTKDHEYENDGIETIMSSLVKMKTFEAKIDIHQFVDANGRTVSEEVYVNGHQMTKQELENLFGNTNPMISAKDNTVIQVLN